MDNNCGSVSINIERNWLKSIPFLPSEKIRLIDATINGHICLTTYRLIFYMKHQTHTISLPNHLIRRADTSLGHLNIITKIGTTFVCLFDSVLTAEKWNEKINLVMEYPGDLSQVFAYGFRRALKEFDINHPFLKPIMNCLELNNSDTAVEAALTLHEFNRMEFNKQWKITDVNSDFKICPSYPKYHIMPRNISDADIPLMAEFRSHKRFPSVVWRSKKTGAILLRCAQPCVGLMYYRNELDEQFVRAVLSNCREDPKSMHHPSGILIVDARNWRTAQLNRFRGGGFEYVEYYEQSQIRFMNLPNLHYVRDSFERLVRLYDKPDSSWYSSIETTKWLDYIGQLLKSASEVATALGTQGRPVMVHCTDGWDRTPQLTSLAQILLDPYYRSIQGFCILVEREWLQFGHKFADRCGHGEETSPIFLQWLDCVRQVHRQFPSYFEFNELFLIKLAMHTYSGLFGTFLCNSERERQATHSSAETCSVWAFLNPKHNWSICNYLYEPKHEVIKPACHVRNLDLWDSLYQNALLPCTIVNTSTASDVGENCEIQQEGQRQSPSLPSLKQNLSTQLLEVTTPKAVTTSSGPPTHASCCYEEAIRNQQFTEDMLVPGDLPRSQSLSTLTMNNHTCEDQLAIAKTSVEAHFALPTLSTPAADTLLPTVRSFSLSAPRKRDENEVEEGRQKLSRSHTELMFDNSDQLEQQIPSRLEMSDTPTVVAKLVTVSNSPIDIGDATHTNLRAFHSDREISNKQKPEHNRCSSDPPSALFRLRISSLVGDDLLWVDNQDEDPDNVEIPDVISEEFRNFDFDTDVLSTAMANTAVLHLSSEEGRGRYNYSPTGVTVSSTACSLPNHSSTLHNDNTNLDNNLDIFNQQLRPTFSTMSISSSTDGLGPWGQNYFIDPKFSSSFTNLNKDVHSSRGTEKGEVEGAEEKSGGPEINMYCERSNPGTLLASSHFHHEHQYNDVSPFHQHQNITRSKTVVGAPGLVNAESLVRHSTSLRFSSPPENLDQFLFEGSSRDAKPLCPMWPSDWDGLPMRIDTVTWRLHQKLREEARARADLQTQIDVLNSQQQSNQTMIYALLEEVNRLRLISESSAHPALTSIGFHNPNHSSSSSSDNFPINNNSRNSVYVNGDRPSTIAEALSEAMDQLSNGSSVGDNLEDRMTKSITDDELLKVMDGGNHLRPTCAPPLRLSSGLLQTQERDVVRSLSFCSDVSSFELVDAKEVNGTQICGGCSLAFNLQGPLKSCRNCDHLFCSPCFERVTRLHDGAVSQLPRLCSTCYHKLSNSPVLQPPTANFHIEPSLPTSRMPQLGTSPNFLLFDDDSSSQLGVHSRYTVKCSNPSENLVNGKNLNSSRCRSGCTANTTSASNGHSQKGVARA